MSSQGSLVQFYDCLTDLASYSKCHHLSLTPDIIDAFLASSGVRCINDIIMYQGCCVKHLCNHSNLLLRFCQTVTHQTT